MRLEPELWAALAEIGTRERKDLGSLVRQIEATSHDGSRTSAVRVFLVQYFRDAAVRIDREPANGNASRSMTLDQPASQVV
jgi:predicted DNA-binding ribbon-helix-helix protein